MYNIHVYTKMIDRIGNCSFRCEDRSFGEPQNCVTYKTMFDQAAMVTVCQPVKIDF